MDVGLTEVNRLKTIGPFFIKLISMDSLRLGECLKFIFLN